MEDYDIVDNVDLKEVTEKGLVRKLFCFADGGYATVKNKGHYCFMISSDGRTFHRYYDHYTFEDFEAQFDLGNDHAYFFTHNVMEYVAVLKLVEKLPRWSRPVVYLDSKLVVEQLNHEWRINYDHLKFIANIIWKTMKTNDIYAKFLWLPREENLAGKFLETKEI